MLISVIVPCFNSEKTIGLTLSSILLQTYSNLEVIIVDNCSADNSELKIKSFDDQRIKYFKRDRDYGAGASRNYALNHAKGEIISYCDADDFWDPEYLQKVAKIFSDNLEINFVYARFIKQDPNLYTIEGSNIYGSALQQGYLCAPSVISVKKDFLLNSKVEWPPRMWAEDDYFTFELSKTANIKLIREDLIYYGAGPNNWSSKSKEVAEGTLKLYLYYKNDIIKYCGASTFRDHLITTSILFSKAGLYLKSMSVFFKYALKFYSIKKEKKINILPHKKTRNLIWSFFLINIVYLLFLLRKFKSNI